MKLFGFIALLSLTMMFLSFNPIDAQVLSYNFTSNATTTAGLSQDFYKYGNGLFDKGQYQDALFFYNKALQIDSTNINALYNTALTFDRLNKTSDAISYYDKVLAISPNDTDTLTNKAVDLDSLGKYVEAISYYDKVIAINPTDTDVLYNKALSLDKLGKHDDAVSYYGKVLAIDPTNVDALNKMHLTFSNLNKTGIDALQQPDKTLLLAIGAMIAILGSIIVINLAIKRTRISSRQKVSQNNYQIEEDKSAETKIQDDDEWKGV